MFSGPVGVELDADLLTLWKGSTSLERASGPAPKAALGANPPPASAASSSGTGTAAILKRLIGPQWALQSITTNGQTWHGTQNPRFFLTFSKNGFGGADGCNSVGGDATYSADSIRLRQGFTTDVACSGPALDRMQKAFQTLVSAPVTANDLPAGRSRSPVQARCCGCGRTHWTGSCPA